MFACTPECPCNTIMTWILLYHGQYMDPNYTLNFENEFIITQPFYKAVLHMAAKDNVLWRFQCIMHNQ